MAIKVEKAKQYPEMGEWVVVRERELRPGSGPGSMVFNTDEARALYAELGRVLGVEKPKRDSGRRCRHCGAPIYLKSHPEGYAVALFEPCPCREAAE